MSALVQLQVRLCHFDDICYFVVYLVMSLTSSICSFRVLNMAAGKSEVSLALFGAQCRGIEFYELAVVSMVATVSYLPSLQVHLATGLAQATQLVMERGILHSCS